MNILQLLRLDHLKKKGRKLLVKGNYQKAYKIFQKVLLIQDSVENIFNLGITLMSLGKYTEAEQYLDKVYQKFPDNELNTLSIAECKLMLKKWTEAQKYYTELIKINPRRRSYAKYLQIAEDTVLREKYVKAKYLFLQADEAFRDKDQNTALKFLQQAEEYYPNEPTMLHNIGTLYFRMKNYSKACSYYSKALQQDKNNKEYKKSLQRALVKKQNKNKLK